MSRCIECWNEMDPIEAQYSYVCGECKRKLKLARREYRVRTLSEPGTECIGRKHLAPGVVAMIAPKDDESK